MSNVIINTTTFRNNGDVALITVLGKSIESYGHNVLYATPHPEIATKLQGVKNTCPEVLGYKRRIFQKETLSNVAAIWELATDSAYRNADAIIGAPGGYINSYYGYSWRRSIYKWAHRSGKKTGIYAQSIGPLNPQDKHNLAALGSFINAIMVRDSWSLRNALDAGLPREKIIESVDAIFLSSPSFTESASTSNTIGISVRAWGHDERDEDRYTHMMKNIALIALKRGYSVEFISTCQGIPNYIDDSVIAQKILSLMEADFHCAGRASVNKSAHSIDDLRKKISTYRFVVGTRLHMCLLSLMAGIPAFNISYERKGLEAYQYIGLSDYSIDYNQDANTTEHRFNAFLSNEATIKNIIKSNLPPLHSRAIQDFDIFMQSMSLA